MSGFEIFRTDRHRGIPLINCKPSKASFKQRQWAHLDHSEALMLLEGCVHSVVHHFIHQAEPLFGHR